MDFRDLIPKISNALELKEGELYLLHFFGENKDLDILDKFSLELAKRGVLTIKWPYSRDFLKDYYSTATEKALIYPDKFFNIFDSVDGVIDICTNYPTDIHEDFPKDKIPFYGQYMQNLMKKLSNKNIFIQIKVPTLSNYPSNLFSNFQSYEQAFLNSIDIDYLDLKSSCENLIDKLKGKKNIEIRSKNNNLLTFSLAERKWYADYGNGDLPAGEIFIAPIESSCNGSIFIPIVEIEDCIYENITLDFMEGRLINCSNKEVLNFIKNLPGDSNLFAEFGIGLNKNAQVIGYTPIDEKAIGTCHIAIGMNDMFGGKNNAPIHIDFVLTPDELNVDGDLLILNDL